MSLIARAIVEAATRTLSYADRLLPGVTPAMFARMPSPGGAMIQTNHPAFVFGHLALYPARFLENAGKDAGATAVPAGYAGLFAAGVECRDDPTGTIYPAMEEIVAHFRRSHAELFRVMSEMRDEEFAAPPATERSRAFVSTVAALGVFYFAAHTMNHLGQVSAWRRCMGLPAA